MHFDLLQDLVIVFGLGLLVVLLFSWVRLPPLVGFLLTGILVGPYGFKLIREPGNVELLAEVGIVILLFTIGVEFSLAGLMRLGKVVGVGGSIQVLATGTASFGTALLLGLSPRAAALTGMVVSLSSTAIAIRLLGERGETTTPQGRISLGILIFQDLAVVPMVLAVPILAGEQESVGDIALTFGKAVGVVAVALVAARKLVPKLLHVVIATRSRELFLLTIIILCIGTAWLTSELGLSLALGAFLAGLVVSESEYSHHALSEVLPFRDAFTCLFFVSMGMLLDLPYVASVPFLVLGATAAVLIGKAGIVWGTALLLGYPVRVALLSALFLWQIGEFSFILLHEGEKAGILTGEPYNLLMAVTVISMAATPVFLRLGPWLTRWTDSLSKSPHSSEETAELKDHVVVVGFGINGQNVARVLKHVRMKYVIVELAPDVVRRLREQGEPVLYGDATRGEVLRHAGAERARVLVVTVPDAASARAIVGAAKTLHRGIHVVVRTRFVQEVDALYRMGANEVVPEEFETSIEIFARVLRQYMVPRDVVEGLTREVRGEGYEMLRTQEREHRPVDGLRRLLADVEMEVYRVGEASDLVGRTIGETEMRQKTGVLILAIHRNHKTTPNPPADWKLELNDVALVLGSPESLAKAGAMFRGTEHQSPEA